jgi:hypothetical protein
MAVVSIDRRNTIILTEVDGVLFNEKKVQARGVSRGSEAGVMGAMEARRVVDSSGASIGQAYLVDSCASGADRRDLSTPEAALKSGADAE